MKDTNIQWCDSTVNPTSFRCDGCELWVPKRTDGKRCYSGRWAERMGGIGAFAEPIELKPGRMAAAAKWPDLRGKARPDKSWIPKELPRLVFIGDMTDLFCDSVPFEYLRTEVVEIVAQWPHIGIILTKRPTRMAMFHAWLKQRGIPWPDNLWAGTSVTSRATLTRIASLVAPGYPRTLVSLEPLWESVVGTVVTDTEVIKGLERFLSPVGYDSDGDAEPEKSLIDWVIAGGESGPHAKPCSVEWLKEIVDLCGNSIIDSDAVPCFIKQLGSYSITHNANTMDYPLPTLLESAGDGFAAARIITLNEKGGAWQEWPDQLQVRQFPKPS